MFKKLLKLTLICFLVNLAPVNVSAAGSAKLFLSPASGSFEVGKSFNANVMVDSGGGPGINASEGVIKFDPAYLTISKISDTGTIFKLWTTDPTYSNSNGTVNFGGGLYTAYKGGSGQIFTISFIAKKAGDTKIEFTSGSVLAADGIGTNVLGGYGSANIKITEAVPAKELPTEKPKPKTEEKTEARGMVPPLPDIDSTTHPEENIWYADNNPELVWKLLADLSGVSFNLDEDVSSDPGKKSDGLVETKKYSKQADGEWYFHIKYQNKSGWGPIKHKKVLIDTTAPVLANLKINDGGDSTNPTPVMRFDAKDETSGIDYFMLLHNAGKNKIPAKDITDGSYRLAALLPGEHDMLWEAFDKAGNSASSSLKFFVDPLKQPIITDIPKIIKKNEELIIRGASFYPGANIEISIGLANKDPEVFSVKTDQDGNWVYFHKGRIEKNNYEIWAKLIDSRGAQSYPTGKHLVAVIAPSLMEVYGWYLFLLLLLIIFALFSFIIYREKKFYEEKIRIMRETKEAKQRLTEIFTALREETGELLELADKKPGLSETERRVKEKIQEALEISEEFIGKELEDINKEINLKTEK
jgi:hypothetical protein